MNEDNDCVHVNEDERAYRTINTNLNEINTITRKAASMFIHMVARNIRHSFMKKDARPTSFNISFIMFNGEYLGSIDCNNCYQKYSIEGLCILLNDVESILNREKPFPDNYDIFIHASNDSRIAYEILQQMKNNVKLSTIYNSDMGNDEFVITIKPGSYHLEIGKDSMDNLTIVVDAEEEIKLPSSQNE